jgi:hypothetical protein
VDSIAHTVELRKRLIWMLLLSSSIVLVIVSAAEWLRTGVGRNFETSAPILGTVALIFLSLSGLMKDPAKSWLLVIAALIVATEVWMTLL